MVKEAVAYYHELLEDAALAESSRQMLDEGLEEAKLIFGGRRLSPYLRPHFVEERDWARIVEICETVWSALQKVKDAAVADAAILDELGLTDIEKELVAIDPKYSQVSPSARLDSFLTEDAYSFVELNGESPAGIAFADSAYDIFGELPVMKRFGERYKARKMYGSQHLLDVLLNVYREFSGGRTERKPQIAIVDLKGLPTQKEFELFQEFFERQGYSAIIASPDELEFSGGRLRRGDFEIDIVYKRLLVNEFLPIMDEHAALLEAYRAGAVCLSNSFRSKLVHKKAIFAVLTNEKYRHLFNDDERAKIAAHVPWTRTFRQEQTEYNGEKIDLVTFARQNRDRMVLKPNDEYGGTGIFIGWNSSESEWDDAINASLADGDYLLQERVKTAKEKFPQLNGNEFSFSEQLVDLDPLLFDGKVKSAFTRLSTTELANVSSGGGMVPTFIISEK
jgi:hypothetical protein